MFANASNEPQNNPERCSECPLQHACYRNALVSIEDSNLERAQQWVDLAATAKTECTQGEPYIFESAHRTWFGSIIDVVRISCASGLPQPNDATELFYEVIEAKRPNQPTEENRLSS